MTDLARDGRRVDEHPALHAEVAPPHEAGTAGRSRIVVSLRRRQDRRVRRLRVRINWAGSGRTALARGDDGQPDIVCADRVVAGQGAGCSYCRASNPGATAAHAEPASIRTATNTKNKGADYLERVSASGVNSDSCRFVLNLYGPQMTWVALPL